MVGEAGLEPTTPGLEGRCSIQLSYSPVTVIVSSSGAPPGFHQVHIGDHGQCKIERTCPALSCPLSRRAAAFDKPRHGKSRCPLDFSAPEDEFHPGRARW